MQVGRWIDMWGWRRRLQRFGSGWASRSRDDIQFFDTGLTQFRYRARGEGQSVLFVADPPITLEGYDALLDVYARRFRVVVVEAPAMGFSAVRGRFDFTFAQATREMALFMEAIVGPKAITAFSCVAGLSSIALAAERPDLIDRVVLIQTPSWEEEVRWKHSRDPQGVLHRPVIGQLVMKKLRTSRAPMWFKLSVGRKEHLENWCACAQQTLEEGAGWGLASAFQHYLTDRCQLAQTMQQPLLIIWGESDGSHPDTVRDSARRHASGQVSVVTYPDLGHFPELEDVERVYSDISAFADGRFDKPSAMRPISSET